MKVSSAVSPAPDFAADATPDSTPDPAASSNPASDSTALDTATDTSRADSASQPAASSTSFNHSTPTVLSDAVPARCFILPDGRRLAYSEYGASRGRPCFYLHDSGSSRLEADFFNSSARRHGYRLIAVDRPGIGGSDYVTLREPADFCADLIALADNLCMERFAVMAMGAGGIYSLNLAHQYPQRVLFQLCLAGVPGSVFNESRAPTYAAACWNELTPVLVRLLVRMRLKFFRQDSAQYLSRLQDGLSYTDRKALNDPLVRARLQRDQLEVVRAGYRGLAQDSALCFRKLPFSLSEVHVPTYIWQGGADRLSQRADSEYMLTRMPNVQLQRIANRGHFFFLQAMDRVFAGSPWPARGDAVAA